MGSNGYPEVHLEEHHYQAVVDLLRNEGPLQLHYDDEVKPLLANITSTNEVVGEGELSTLMQAN